jgi:TldD protein
LLRLTADIDPSWDAALLEAAGLEGSRARRVLLFLEDREDLRIEVSPEGVQESVQSRLRGLSVRGGPGGCFEAAIADPSPSDALPLAEAAAAGAAPRWSAKGQKADAGSRIDPRAALVNLERLVRVAERAVGRKGSLITARWIAFRQGVRVAGPGRDIAADSRMGCRVRLDVRVRGRGTEGKAVGERVLRTGPVKGLESLAAAVVQRAFARLDAREAPRGKFPIAFAPGVGGILIHELVGHALEADTVRRGASALAAAADPIATKQVLIVDDPRRGRAAWRLDDEGEEAMATTLVRDGKRAGLIHDQRSAEAAAASPNGHGRRSSFQEPVRPRMGCTFLAAGTLDAAEVLEGIPRGVYIHRMEAASVDTSTGEATFRVTDADLVQRGQLDRPLKPFVLAVATREALSTLDRIASDLAFDTCIGSCLRDGQPLATSVGAPTFRTGLTTVIP